MNSFFTKLLSEVDNVTPDISKILATICILAGLAFQGYQLYKHPEISFDMQNFGTGIGILFAGVAAALSLKKESPVEK